MLCSLGCYCRPRLSDSHDLRDQRAMPIVIGQVWQALTDIVKRNIITSEQNDGRSFWDNGHGFAGNLVRISYAVCPLGSDCVKKPNPCFRQIKSRLWNLTNDEKVKVLADSKNSCNWQYNIYEVQNTLSNSRSAYWVNFLREIPAFPLPSNGQFLVQFRCTVRRILYLYLRAVPPFLSEYREPFLRPARRTL